MSADRVPLSRFWQPRYWHVWLGLGAMRLIAILPFRAQLFLGRNLGRVARLAIGKRRRTAVRNLEKCMPELDAAARETLVHKHFESVGIGLVEMAFTWWGSAPRKRRLAHVEGVEHLHAALAAGRGVILLAGHFTTIEIGASLLLLSEPFHAMYRRFENPLFEEVMRRRRGALAGTVIQRGNFREMIRSLRSNTPVLYMPDQAYVRQNSIRAPFFALPAPTSTGTARLAKMSGAKVVPFLPQRLPGAQGYRLHVFPALEDFPSGDDLADATRINAVVEKQVRMAPEQYLWVHRRFKGEAGFYD